MPNPVVHFEILGKDKALLDAFYTSVFDWQLSPIDKDYSVVNTGSGIGGGIGATGPNRVHSMFYVAVADVETTLVAVESHGGRTAFGPHPIPDGGVIAGFLDPEGHLIGLVQGPEGM